MKTKKKMIAIVEIAVVMCSVFLVAIPAIAAEDNTQKVSASAVTTASADDYVLGVYGNANEDDTIDMGDVVYTKLAIFGKKSKTELCDAKYDGRINVLDVIQTKLIILGKEKELTVVDTLDRIVTVKKPLKRIVPTYLHALETLRSIKVPEDVIVGLGTSGSSPTPLDPVFFAEFSDVPSIGCIWNPDVEAILELNPDAVFLFDWERGSIGHAQDVLESADITVLRFDCQTTEIHQEEVKKLGYIFDREKDAEEYLDWREDILNSVKETVEKIPEEDKPKVYFETSGQYGTHSKRGGNFIKAGGGKNILEGMSGKIDAEAVIAGDPDIIVKLAPWTAGGYGVDADDTAELKALREEIMSRPELQKVKAVEEGEVYILANHLVSFYQACGCRALIGYAYFAKWLHPTLFEDLDPKAIHQEYLTRFQGLDIDLDKQGVFAYPEPS